ncbi:hypothetical protein AWV80_04340 [Cupriavidus sp. UYMU48A]|nr:hypothetical protein AWV80_04340 [Cupriavidus sp. UYMU48A]
MEQLRDMQWLFVDNHASNLCSSPCGRGARPAHRKSLGRTGVQGAQGVGCMEAVERGDLHVGQQASAAR